jgi:UDP-2,3-diacylglucosamine hydrolase
VIGHRLVVVADAHLGAAPPDDENAFLAFLDAVPGLGDALLLAGDIYDFWFTYRHTIPRSAIRVTSAIVALARRMPVLMVGGNHDRWGDTFWDREVGVTFDPRELRFRIGERNVRAIHGDGLHEERRTAAILNRVLDTRLVISTFGMLPTNWGHRIADHFGHDPAFAAAHPEVIEAAAARQAEWAERALEADPTLGALIMGHTHREVRTEVEPNRWYLNPGQWLHDHRYATLDGDEPQLAVFS